ncbi:hypothetical protein SBFV2_gp66 [Sulfolobales Beppu filamentous virus 2]|uniref:Uncharacterized protein n=1 Tax=Sulfolobales Beppu filamentous virus 2 TaxID=2493123 RepID=A0A3Q8Q3U8_9VIRU|nr:hypothetical protein HOU84_gp66 [Sulfolobales Beppu filamentous virus 2]AZI75833.1 hypothetical protein SBFV2_gp66 [Sulfolobales Beppu filamentous virus 2]
MDVFTYDYLIHEDPNSNLNIKGLKTLKPDITMINSYKVLHE